MDVVADAAIAARTCDAGADILEVRGKSETTEHSPIFANKTAGCRGVKRGSGRSISVFHRTSGLGPGGERHSVQTLAR